jgi:DNA-binding NarL/FixJ family response regulator
MGKTSSILLASNHFFVECSWKYLTNQDEFDFTIVDIAKTQEELEKKTIEFQPKIIVIDIDCSEFNLKKSLAFIDITIQSKVIFTGKLKTLSFYEEFSHLNVNAFISNNLNKEQLINCLFLVKNNQKYSSPEIVLLNQNANLSLNNSSIEKFNISDRELEIIKLIAEGYINKEIADKLFISNHTVNTHRKNIMQKLGINNTAGIVLFAVKEGLVSPNDFLFSSKNH